MTPADYAFYAFGGIAVVAGLLMTLARNPVHSVLWMILAFLSSAGLMVRSSRTASAIESSLLETASMSSAKAALARSTCSAGMSLIS